MLESRNGRSEVATAIVSCYHALRIVLTTIIAMMSSANVNQGFHSPLRAPQPFDGAAVEKNGIQVRKHRISLQNYNGFDNQPFRSQTLQTSMLQSVRMYPSPCWFFFWHVTLTNSSLCQFQNASTCCVPKTNKMNADACPHNSLKWYQKISRKPQSFKLTRFWSSTSNSTADLSSDFIAKLVGSLLSLRMMNRILQENAPFILVSESFSFSVCGSNLRHDQIIKEIGSAQRIPVYLNSRIILLRGAWCMQRHNSGSETEWLRNAVVQ